MNTRICRIGVSFLVTIIALDQVPELIAGGRPAHVATPHNNGPARSMPHQTMSRQVMPRQVMPRQVMPRQTMPRQVMPRQVMPRQVMPRQVNKTPMRSNQVGVRQTNPQNLNRTLTPRNYTARSGVRGSRGYYGSSRGYGSTNRTIRTIIGQLRSTHASLARLDHDYQGHRVRALYAIHTAIRQLSQSSTGSSGRNTMAMNRSTNRPLAARTSRLPQAQSDARMRQAFQRLQSINNQLSYQGNRQMRAQGSVQVAMRELGTALTVR